NFQPESIDFILTDPPYGNSIQYYELAKLWNAWLNFSNSPKDEIVINSRQGKDLAKYKEDLQSAFENCYAILKPYRYMVVTFHNNNFEIRNALITAVISAGFELQHVLFQVPPRRSLKAYLHPLGTPIGDYYIRFYKGTEKAKPAPIPEKHLEKTILDIFEHILTNRGEPTPLLWMGNLVDSHFAQAGLFPFPERVKLDEICASSSRFSIENGALWFAQPRKMHLPLPLSQRIQQLLDNIFQDKVPPYSREDKKTTSWRVMREFSGDLTPDPLVMRDLIQGMENAR
ncbi:MAG TPA: hypothetical protein VKK79_18560, partial [Candidatus Lokiarchaeia archaeon]|nr:hypothetical protein [Candidatus Lokiarchaeia archaeon]